MDNAMDPFVFGKDRLRLSSDDYIAHVSGSLDSRDKLFDALIKELRLPAYFGENWDALSECLRDLSWIEAKRVIIIHGELPSLDRPALRTYLEVLDDCIKDWKPEEDHELVVVFPAGTRQRVCDLLKESPS